MAKLLNGLMDAYLERETVTGELRTRLFHLDQGLVVTDGEGNTRTVAPGSIVLVVDRSRAEQPLVERLLDHSEQLFHFAWSSHHQFEETRTPLDLRPPEAGGRETPAIPF